MSPVPTNDTQIPSQPPRPPPSCPQKWTQFEIGFLVQKNANVLKPMKKIIFWSLVFWQLVDFVLKFLENSDRFLRTWFKNANQCYPVTSWLLASKTKFFGLENFSNFQTKFFSSKTKLFFFFTIDKKLENG